MTETTTPDRIESLDLLRGLCAIGVACYHVLSWAELATLHNLGLYGVYTFFLISGASMTVAYAPRFRRGYPATRYLALRYLRLAPLYALTATFAAVVFARPLYPAAELIGRWLLNVTFLFGAANPGQTSLVTGGWSLGIEFVFYLLFPLLLVVLGARRGWWLAVALLAVQLVFVNIVLHGTTLEKAWVPYTQVAAFIGYFGVGIWVGLARVDGQFGTLRWPAATWVGWLVLVGLISVLSGPTAESSLTGARGVGLTAACCALLALTIGLDVPQPLRWFARLVGDASYPLYLLHPITFFMLARNRWFAQLRADQPIALAVIALVIAFVAAVAVHRFIEAPILAWGKRRIAAR
jgi:peptidoglycan/LPS O-acetylase OafA/YrhL